MTPDIAQAFMQDTMERFVRPEIERRAAAGEGFSGPLWAAQIILGEETGTTRVRLNAEVQLQVKVEGVDEWRDYAELRAGGPTIFREVSLMPDEAEIRHITMCHVGEGDEWTLLFNFAGSQQLRDGTPGLGVVFTSPDASDPPMTKLRARVEQLFDAVAGCLEREHFESAMILLYSGIDAMAWLNRPTNVDDVRGVDFQEWVDAYFLPGSGFNCSATDLYGARCGLVHSNTGESRLHRQGRARKVFYYREREGVKEGIIQLMLDEAQEPWFIDVDQFIDALRTAIDRFIDAISNDATRLATVSEWIHEYYFSRGTFLGTPAANDAG
jgi:hypothetical protein